jgi:hypothetical protein
MTVKRSFLDTFYEVEMQISHQSSFWLLALDHGFLINYLDGNLVTGCSLLECSIYTNEIIGLEI